MNLVALPISIPEELCDILVQIYCHLSNQPPTLGHWDDVQAFAISNNAEMHNLAHESFGYE